MLKHTFEATSRPPKSPLKQCQDGSTFPDQVAYLRELARVIMSANPETFKGPYAPEHFCFAIELNSEINARADATNGLITFNSATVVTAPSDAAIAGILAHELAHVTMQHPFTIHPKLAQSTAYHEASENYEGAIQAFNKAMATQNEERAILASNIDRQLAEIIGEMVPEFQKEREGWLQEVVTFVQAFNSSPTPLPQSGEAPAAVPNAPQSGQQGPFAAVTTFIQRLYTPGVLTEAERSPLLKNNYNMPAYAAPGAQLSDKVITKFNELKGRFDQMQATLLQTQPDQMAKMQADMAAFATLSATPLAEQGAFDEANKRLRSVVTQVLGVEEEANWSEREADEVGFELYIKAKFQPAIYTWIELQQEEEEARRACEAEVKKAQKDNQYKPAITRGTMSHPAGCWRFYDLMVLEARTHAKDYESLLPRATVVEIDQARLSGLQADLKTKLEQLQKDRHATPPEGLGSPVPSSGAPG